MINELLPLDKAAEWANQAALKNNWPVAAQRWTVLRRAYPGQGKVWIQGAKAYIETNELEQANQLLQHARQHFPQNPNAFLISADLAIKQQEWDAAETFLQYAREKFPDFTATWLTSAKCSEHKGNQKKAEEYNLQARERFPELIEPFVQYAELAMRTQEWRTALERWQLVRKYFPDAAIGYRSAAEVARKLGESRLARQLLLSHEFGEQLFDNERQPIESSSKPSRSGTLSGLIWTKAIFNLRSEGHRNYLSYAWLALEPMMHILVYYVVFGLIMKQGGENFIIFLLVGQIPWMWFSKAVSGSSGSILAGQNLMLLVGVPAIIFPLINLVKVSLQQIPVFLLLLGFIALQGFLPNIFWWWLIPTFIVQMFLIAAVTCTVAAIIPFSRDLNYLVQIGLMFLMFGSGIFYDYKTLSVELQELFMLNPVAFIIGCYRDILIDGVLPDVIMLGWWGLGSIICCLLLLAVYKKLRYVYPRIVME